MLSSSIALDSFIHEEDNFENIRAIPDSFHFDDFFSENFFIFLFFLYFFSNFFFYIFFVFSCMYYINITYLFADDEKEMLDIFDSESDLSHYTYREFTFVNFVEED